MPLSAKQKIAIAERDRKVIELKSRGMTFEMIAKAGIDGVSHAQQAKKCFDRGLANRVAVAANQYRALENEKLDLAERTVIGIMSDPEEDPKTKLKAAGTLVNIATRRARLNGIDAQPSPDTGTTIKTVFVSSAVLSKDIRADDE